MAENCTHDCSTCSANCSSKKPESLLIPANPLSEVKHIVGVVSGKGGVGKSLVTSMLAVTMQRKGLTAAILDGDITGPSIPKEFGIYEKARGTEDGLFPSMTKSEIRIMSTNLLLENETDPVIWRGPVIAGMVKQFWSDVIWGDVDFMFVDMPPGTGDVPLTVFQSLPIKGIVVVTSPQELVSMIVEKAVNMAKMMSIPVLGIVENMSYFECPDCKKRHSIYGESHIDEIAEKHGIPHVAKLPICEDIARWCDKGLIELYEGDWLDKLSDGIEEAVK